MISLLNYSGIFQFSSIMFLRQIVIVPKRFAGHSKWANIKHTKAEKDTQRSQLFVQLARRIKVAIQENGNNSNPLSNLHLAQAIESAKRNDMPASSIQNCIKATQANKEGAKLFRYSIKGPRGSILLVTTFTSSQKKTKHDLQTTLNKVGGLLSDVTLESVFVQKGVVIAKPPSGSEQVEELSVDHAIEAGAEEVSPLDEDNNLIFSCDASQLYKVKTKLEEFQYKIEDSKLTFIPKMKVSLGDDEMELMSKIMFKVEEIPEVMAIHDNIE